MSNRYIVDSHQHAFWKGKDDHGLIRDMDEHGIRESWLLSWEMAVHENRPEYHSILNPLHRRADGTHQGIPLQDLLIAHDHYPDRFVLGYCPHPLCHDAPKLLRTAAEMYGVRICGEWKFRIPFDDPRCLELFRMAGTHRMPVILHLDVPYLKDAKGELQYQPNWYGGTHENLERALIACKETTFIGHAPGFWREIGADADEESAMNPEGLVRGQGRLYDLLDRHSNLMADLSANSGLHALQRDAGHAKQFIEHYSERLLFGRDQYGGRLLTFLETLDLSQTAKDNIFYRNAEKLLTA